MALILHLETATLICSVALSSNGELLLLRETTNKNSHSEVITTLIEEMVAEAGINLRMLDAVAVSEGPGSYTGLRIGVSTAKGLCYALDKPLIAVNTLHSIAYGISKKYHTEEDLLFCPMIDARRMEVYTTFFNHRLENIVPVSAMIIQQDTFSEYFQGHRIVFGGDGAEKCKEIFVNQPKAIFSEINLPSASFMVNIAEQKFQLSQFENLAYFEPFYLKEFIAGVPKVKGLH